MDFKLKAVTYGRYIKQTKENICAVAKTAFAILGVLLTLANIVDRLFGSTFLIELCRANVLIILCGVFLLSVYLNREKYEMKVKVNGAPDVAITLKVCDALDNEGAVIIPTNTTFDTLMEDDFISKDSLQGQYQLKYFPASRLELDELIIKGMDEGKNFSILKGRQNTKQQRYPIGTVSKITGIGVAKRAYFLASSDIDKKGIPIDVNVAEITDALVGLWDALAKMGNMETYSIPLIGTGKAGIKDATREDVVKQIILSFLNATQEHKITENLIICIHPIDVEKISWKDLCEFLKYQCLFGFHQERRNEKPVGKAEPMKGKSVSIADMV